MFVQQWAGTFVGVGTGAVARFGMKTPVELQEQVAVTPGLWSESRLATDDSYSTCNIYMLLSGVALARYLALSFFFF